MHIYLNTYKFILDQSFPKKVILPSFFLERTLEVTIIYICHLKKNHPCSRKEEYIPTLSVNLSPSARGNLKVLKQ